MGKKDSRHDHRKSSHKKKHKKEKKKYKKKSKHRRDSSSSSDSSDVSLSSRDSDSECKVMQKKHVDEKVANNVDEREWDFIFSDKHAIVKEKNVKKKEQPILDQPGQSVRELNPYWKNGGNGLPPSVATDYDKNIDGHASKNLLREAKEVASKTGKPLEKMVENKWENSDRHLIGESRERGLVFKKPGEIQESNYINTYKRNWMKKGENHINKREDGGNCSTAPEVSENVADRKPTLTNDELNALAAKAMKAEIMGNKALAEELRRELEIAKKSKDEASTVTSAETGKKREEVILLTKTNTKGLTRPMTALEAASGERTRTKRNRENERLRCFMDDDKHSLQSMFEKEKFATSDESDEMFLKMMKRKRNNEDDDDEEEFFKSSSNVERERTKNMNESMSRHKSLENCRWCLDGINAQKHLIISVGVKAYLCLPSSESLTENHCIIAPIHHTTCGTLLDEDVWDEIMEFRKALCKMFRGAGQDVVFFENARSFRRHPHMVLHCVPVDKEIGDLAPIYFKKAILESETEWSTNKKLIDLRGKDLRRSVPKGLPYFTVDFGMDAGFAHVIEDEKLFPGNFAEEIIGGMLDLEPSKWRKRRKESFEVQKEKASAFLHKWKNYDFSMEKHGKSTNVSSYSSSD